MKKFFTLLILLAVQAAWAQNYKTDKEVSYTSKTDDYSAERLKLDVYYPKGAEDAPVVVWFHGGGLVQGKKEIPWKLKEKGIVVVGGELQAAPESYH